MKATYLTKDQNWQEAETVYWFQIDGDDYGSGVSFEGETFGVVESSDDTIIVDSDGCPIDGNGNEVVVRNALEGAVTDAMREE